MTLKARVKEYFVKPPCFFAWGEDDTQIVRRDTAALQCKTDHTATLVVTMPPNDDTIVKYNVNLLTLLLVVAGWKSGDAWLTQCFRAARQSAKGGIYRAKQGKTRYRLIVDRQLQLTTLTVEEKV